MSAESHASEDPKPRADEPVKMSRRDFLKSAGVAVATGIVGRINIEAVAGVLDTENIPTEEGIEQTFNHLRGERSCSERRKHSDERGVYLWELEFTIEGGTAEFGYMRKGRYDIGGSASATKIHITYFDEEGAPEGGAEVAVYIDGKWVIDKDFVLTQ